MKNNSIFKTLAGEKEVMAIYDSVLREWPVAYETKMIPTRQGDTFAIVSGKADAPALVLLHGASTNATSWVGEVLEYSRCFRVHALDIPGDPGKSAPSRPSYQGLGYAEWLDDVLTGLHITKASLIGLSQGGWTALRFATYAPAKVEKLVLLAPAGIVPTKMSFIARAIWFSLLGGYGVKKLNRFLFGKQPPHPQVIEFMDIIMKHFKSRLEKEYIFNDTELAKLKMPVLLIGGTEDVIRSSEAIAARMRKHVPQTRSLLIPGMGHVLMNMTGHVVPFLLE